MLFSQVSAVTPLGDGRFAVELSDRWTIVGKPNGGYLLALLGRAVTDADDHPHVLAASAHYLRAPDPGPAVVETERLRHGRSASQFRARLRQGDATCVEALVTTGRLEPGTSPRWDGGAPRPEFRDRDDCVRVPDVTPIGAPAALMGEVDLRLESFGVPTGAGELRGWLELPGGEAFDPLSLLYATDALPPATFDITPSGWVPTIEFTVYVRALPVPGPVAVRQTARLVEADRVDEQCWVWDSAGRLVAQATQLAGVRWDG